MPTDPDLSRSFAQALDAQNPLAELHDRFVTDDATVYLAGNRLGRLSKATADRLAEMVHDEWGHHLARAWPAWTDRLHSVSDALGRDVLEVGPGQVTLGDSTTVNLFKLASAAIALRPGRGVLLVEQDAFATDRYVLQSLAQQHGLQLRTIDSHPDTGLDTDTVRAAVGPDVALGCFSHVAYRSGAVADMPAITELLHDAGALALWDLSHAAGSVRTPLAQSAADLAVGCTYKYLNSGPGAPAFMYVRSELVGAVQQPIWGWFSQRPDAAPTGYQPVGNVHGLLSGTPNILGITAVEQGVRLIAEAGIEQLTQIGRLLTGYAIKLTDDLLAPLGWRVASPRNAVRRGAHLTIQHQDAWQIHQALLARGVIAGFHGPQRLRLGMAPLYTSFEDVWVAVEQIAEVTSSGAYRHFPADGAPAE